ncbi:MAG: triphosphoribosyl-dephospho-CoA synthase [Rubripirellula sp.]
MNDPLHAFRHLACTPAEAVRWACVLEATAPKPGNVFPGRSFADLNHADFVAAAEIAARDLGLKKEPISLRMLNAVDQMISRLGTNVNLGIILLLGPLVAADESRLATLAEGDPVPTWSSAIPGVLDRFDGQDGKRIFLAIQRASAGGMGSSESMDLNESHDSVNILQAMTIAKDRDRIARQYAGGYADLLEHIVPTLRDSITDCGDVLIGICQSHVRLLADAPDSLIARKNGPKLAEEVQQRAGQVDLNDVDSMEAFDRFLRTGGHHLNPGTTADLIAAAIYVLLRTQDKEKTL